MQGNRNKPNKITTAAKVAIHLARKWLTSPSPHQYYQCTHKDCMMHTVQQKWKQNNTMTLWHLWTSTPSCSKAHRYQTTCNIAVHYTGHSENQTCITCTTVHHLPASNRKLTAGCQLDAQTFAYINKEQKQHLAATVLLQLAYYRLKEPILHLLWGLVDMFFGYNFPKPEPMWMKSGT